ncbi:hypothetical protein GCM10007198_29660 [Microbacterium aerolatum]|uniref:Uncharacterized protein n=1 Tax=Microbacterium aerolatum TaxID=153731 RepID=A0A511A9P7_9MICO|nr:hypothetical protein MAE01_00850 [Microbacterium aerolatum]GGB37133.1 hypothetical protein GCM10007198_29660 [Microbacterium aerolatum]
MGEIVVQVAGQLMSGCRAVNEHHADGAASRPSRDREPLVSQGELHARLYARVGDVDALDPDRGERGQVRAQHGVQELQQVAGGFARGADAVRDHVERAAAEAVAHGLEERFDPRFRQRHPQDSIRPVLAVLAVQAELPVQSELHGVDVAPQHGERRVDAGQRGRGDRRHAPILLSRRGSGDAEG